MMSDLGVAGDGFLGGFMGTLSYVLTWVFIFGAAIVAMVVLHIYLPLRKREWYWYYAGELSCLGGLGLFLLLQLVLAGGPQPLPTLAFLILLIPIGVKLLFSSVKDAVTGGAESSGDKSGAVTIVSTSSTREEDDEEDGTAEDVLLVRLGKDRVRGFSAVRVNPTSASTFGEPQGCVTLLVALSKFQSSSTGVEWVFKVDVDPSNGAASYSFIAIASGKIKRRGRGTNAEQNDTVDLVRRATVYLRSALLSAGFTSGDDAPIPGVELLRSLSTVEENEGNDNGGCGVAVTIRGLPEKALTVEDLESSNSQKLRWMRDSSHSSYASLFHPVGRLVRFMVAGNIAGSYVVRFKKTKPPEGITLMDNGMIEATNNSRAYGVRSGGGAGSALVGLRNSVAGRLRLEDREELAEEVMAGVRRGYWSVESYVGLPGYDDSAAVKVSSTIVSCFSGGMRSVETSTLPIHSSSCGSSLVDGCHPFIGDPRFRYLTGDMSSDSLATFITLSPPYPAPSCESSFSVEFEAPPESGGNGNGLLHLGRAYFSGTPVGTIKIPVQDLAMHVIFLGETGFGKTTLVVELIIQLWDIKPELDWTIVDLKGEYLKQVGPHIGEPITVLKPGLSDSHDNHHSEGKRSAVSTLPLQIDLFALGAGFAKGDEGESRKLENCVERVFSILKESLAGLFKENVELSPMMEKVLRESLRNVYSSKGGKDRLSPWRAKGEDDSGGGFFDTLFSEIEGYVKLNGAGKVDVERSCEALKNRVDRFRRGILGEVCNKRCNNHYAGAQTGDVDAVCRGKVIIDLSECVKGGSSREDVRLLVNLIMEVVFESAFRRGLTGAPETRHLTIIEEANLLVPDVLHRRTMGDLTAVEDMILTARAFGEGLVLIAQRPTISAFVLANAGTKVVFRTPFDSRRVGDFMGLNESQEEAVKSLRKFEAIVTTIRGGPYRVSTAKPRPLLRDSEMKLHGSKLAEVKDGENEK